MQTDLLTIEVDLSQRNLWNCDITERTQEEIQWEDENWNIIRFNLEENPSEVTFCENPQKIFEVRKKRPRDLRKDIEKRVKQVLEEVTVFMPLQRITNFITEFRNIFLRLSKRK